MNTKILGLATVAALAGCSVGSQGTPSQVLTGKVGAGFPQTITTVKSCRERTSLRPPRSTATARSGSKCRLARTIRFGSSGWQRQI